MTLQIDSTYQSPNHHPRKNPITILCLHATAGPKMTSIKHLCDPAPYNPKTELEDAALAVSTHYVIDEFGAINQLVADYDVAYHAGVSVWSGWKNVNEFSLGIELVNSNNGRDPYEAAQMEALTDLVEWKIQQYKIGIENVVRHLDVAIPAGRKTDPAGFPWEAWKKSLFGQDVDVWGKWGTAFPLYSDQYHFGIPQAWLKHNAKLGEARSNEIAGDGFALRVFQRGVVLWRSGKAEVQLF